MIEIPLGERNAFGFSKVSSFNYYSSINYIFEYLKDGVFPFIFKEGKDTFGEIITNFAQAELRKAELGNINLGSNEFESERFAKQTTTCGINLKQIFEIDRSISMDVLTQSATFNNPINSPFFIFKDNLLTLSFVPNLFKYDFDLTIKSSSQLKLSDLAGYLYNRIHMGKKFFLKDNINIKYILDEKLLFLFKLLYGNSLTDEEFAERIMTMSKGYYYNELDTTTGNMVSFFDIHTRPMIEISSINVDGETLSISGKLEIQLPSAFWLNSPLSDAEITGEVIKNITLIPDLELSKQDREKMVNFNMDYVINNRQYFPFTDLEIEQIRSKQLDRSIKADTIRYSAKTKTLKAIYDKKVNYTLKSEVFYTFSQELRAFDLHIDHMQSPDDTFIFSVVGSDDKRITEFIKHISAKFYDKIAKINIDIIEKESESDFYKAIVEVRLK